MLAALSWSSAFLRQRRLEAVSDQNVFIVDDEPAVRDSIAMMLERRGYAVRTFASAEDCLSLVKPGACGCIICDVRLEGMSGLELRHKLAEMKCNLPVVLITAHGDIEMAVRAVKDGAFDFIEKPFKDTRLYSSIEQALSTRREQQAKAEELAALRRRIAELTDRQRQVMELLVEGLSNKEIAQRLEISPRTVETYRAFVMARTGASSLADLVKMAVRAQTLL
jgi:two-component system response regulator FixJ